MDMQVINKRDVIKGSRARWLNQYRHYPDDYVTGWAKGKTAGEIRKDLAALDLETCTSEDVDKAIMARGWGNLECDFCGEDKDKLLRMGEEIDYEARWLDVCHECLSNASEFLCKG